MANVMAYLYVHQTLYKFIGNPIIGNPAFWDHFCGFSDKPRFIVAPKIAGIICKVEKVMKECTCESRTLFEQGCICGSLKEETHVQVLERGQCILQLKPIEAGQKIYWDYREEKYTTKESRYTCLVGIAVTSKRPSDEDDFVNVTLCLEYQ